MISQQLRDEKRILIIIFEALEKEIGNDGN